MKMSIELSNFEVGMIMDLLFTHKDNVQTDKEMDPLERQLILDNIDDFIEQINQMFNVSPGLSEDNHRLDQDTLAAYLTHDVTLAASLSQVNMVCDLLINFLEITDQPIDHNNNVDQLTHNYLITTITDLLDQLLPYIVHPSF
jgi:hypothetical protein